MSYKSSYVTIASDWSLLPIGGIGSNLFQPSLIPHSSRQVLPEVHLERLRHLLLPLDAQENPGIHWLSPQ